MALRKRYGYNSTDFSGELINEVVVTIPDLALSIEDIFRLAMDGQDPALEFVPDTSYFEDLSDILPNVDELHVVTPENQNVSENSEQEQKPASPAEQNDIQSTLESDGSGVDLTK